MALSLRRGRVTAVTERVEGLVRLEVDGRACVAYPRLTGPVALRDEVVVNTQSVELGLGSGGFDVLHVNLTRGLGLVGEPGAHVMKLPYTSLQHAARHAEEKRAAPEELTGLPVVCCTLHSQVAPVCAGIGLGRRVAYLQVAGGALPVSLSDTVRALRARGFVGVSVAVGPCIDGDVASASGASALIWSAAEGYEVVVCAVGPGIVGTGSRLGHGALALAEVIVAARVLGGRPILATRASEADRRERHLGLSHHTRAVLAITGDVETAWPAERRKELPPELLERAQLVETEGWQEACSDLPLAHMGRDPEEDALFFEVAFAAGLLAARISRHI